MITSISQTYEFRGLSTDDKSKIVKPGNGSVFREIDTGKLYMYNAQSSDWVEFTPGGGGGGGGASSMSDLEDVSLENLEAGQVLKWDEQEQKWVNADDTAATEIGNLSDVSIDNPTSGQVLKYDANTDTWINEDEAEVIVNLSELEDVDLTNLSDGQMIVYDATNQKWINANTPQGYDEEAHTITLNNFASDNPNTATITMNVNKFMNSTRVLDLLNIDASELLKQSGISCECKSVYPSSIFISTQQTITWEKSTITSLTQLPSFGNISVNFKWDYYQSRDYYRMTISPTAGIQYTYSGGIDYIYSNNGWSSLGSTSPITILANQSISKEFAIWLSEHSTFTLPESNTYGITFEFVCDNKRFKCEILVDYVNEQWVFNSKTITQISSIPNATSADEGKVISVGSNGDYELTEMPEGYDEEAHTVNITNFDLSSLNTATVSLNLDKFLNEGKYLNALNITGINPETKVISPIKTIVYRKTPTLELHDGDIITFKDVLSFDNITSGTIYNLDFRSNRSPGTTMQRMYFELQNNNEMYIYYSFDNRYKYTIAYGRVSTDDDYNWSDGSNPITIRGDQTITDETFINWLYENTVSGLPVRYDLVLTATFDVIDDNDVTRHLNLEITIDEDTEQYNSTITELPTNILPVAPAVNGTYALQATVTSGTPTYSWETQVTYSGGDGIDITSNVVKIDTTNASANDVLSFSGQNISWISPCTSAEITEIVNGLT